MNLFTCVRNFTLVDAHLLFVFVLCDRSCRSLVLGASVTY